jgi:tetratricopeptide (TPR) repeat protein
MDGLDRASGRWAWAAIAASWLALLLGMGSAGAQDPGSGDGAAGLKSAADEARQQGRLLAALDLYRRAVDRDPAWTDGWWYLGTIQFELDRYEDAVRSFDRVLERRPDSVEALALLGLSEFETGDHERSCRHLERALAGGIGRMQGVGDTARLRYGMLLTRRGEFEKAMVLLGGLALEGKHGQPLLQEALGAAALQIPRLPGEISAELREPVLLAGKAMALVYGYQPADAAALLRELVRRFPDLPNVHFVYGNYLIKSDPEAALAQYRRELERQPGHVPSLVQMVSELLFRGQASEALALAEEAVRQSPELFVTRLSLGRVRLALGQADAALEELERAVRLAPDSPDVRFALAQAYRAAGRLADARREGEEFQRLKALQETGTSPAVPKGLP